MNPILAAIISNIIYGCSFYVTKVANQASDNSFYRVVGWRFLVAVAFLSLLILLRVFKVNYKGKKLLPLFMLSLLSPSIYFFTEAVALSYVSSSFVGIMIGIVPIVVAILMRIIFKEIITKKQTVFMIISILGVVVINLFVSGSSQITFKGGVLLLISMLSLSLFNVYIKKASKEFSAIEITYFMMICGAIEFNVADVFLNGFSTVIQSASNLNFVGSIIFLGILTSCGGTLLINYALTKAPSTHISVLNNITTMVSILCGVRFLKESFTVPQMVGCAMIVAGTVGFSMSKRVKNRAGSVT